MGLGIESATRDSLTDLSSNDWEGRTIDSSIEKTENDLDRFGTLRSSLNRYIYLYVE